MIEVPPMGREFASFHCLNCDKPLPDFEPVYCCNGSDCGCMGQNTEPPICDAACWHQWIDKRRATARR